MAIQFKPDRSRMLGDKINSLAEEIAEDSKMSKCAAVGVVATVLLDENMVKLIDFTPEEKKTVENFVLAACLNNNDYLFRK